MRHDSDLNRRRLLALCGGIAGTLLASPAFAQQKLRQQQPPASARAATQAGAAGGPGRRFLSAAEFALLDEIAEAIIPADAKSGGARAAKVAEFIDLRLGESLDTDVRQSWRDDLAEIDRLSLEMFGRIFVAAASEQRVRLLQRISRNERNPQLPGEHAFGTIKWQVSYVYYRTKTGIHDDLEYMGNTIQDDYAGYDPAKP